MPESRSLWLAQVEKSIVGIIAAFMVAWGLTFVCSIRSNQLPNVIAAKAILAVTLGIVGIFLLNEALCLGQRKGD